MKPNKLLIFLVAVMILSGVHFFSTKMVNGQILGATVCFPYQGCTGTSTVPLINQILIGNGSGVYRLSNLGSLVPATTTINGTQSATFTIQGSGSTTVLTSGNIITVNSTSGLTSAITSLMGLLGPSITITTTTQPNVWNIIPSTNNLQFILPSNVSFFTNDAGYLTSVSAGTPTSTINGFTGTVFDLQGTGFLTHSITNGSTTFDWTSLAKTSSTRWDAAYTSSALAHTIATLSGENYLSLSGQAFTAGTINDTNLTAEDFGDFTCDSGEDGCTLDIVYVVSSTYWGLVPQGSLGGTWANPTIDDLFLLNTGDIGSGNYEFTGKVSSSDFRSPSSSISVLWDWQGNKYSTSTGGGFTDFATTTLANTYTVATTTTKITLTIPPSGDKYFSNEQCDIDFVLENPSTNEDDYMRTFNSTSTITQVYSHHRDTNSSTTFNLIWGNGTIASSSARHLFTNNVSSTASSTDIADSYPSLVAFASTTVDRGMTLRLITSKASSRQWGLTVCYNVL